MHCLFVETYTDVGALRLERIDRPGDSRNEFRIPLGHTRDGLTIRATLNDTALWIALFASGGGSANGMWLSPNGTAGLVAAMGALYRFDAMDVRSAVEIANNVDFLLVSDDLEFVVRTNCEDNSLDIIRLHGPREVHEFQCTVYDVTIRESAVVGSYCSCSSDVAYAQIPFRIDLTASAVAPSFVGFRKNAS